MTPLPPSAATPSSPRPGLSDVPSLDDSRPTATPDADDGPRRFPILLALGIAGVVVAGTVAGLFLFSRNRAADRPDLLLHTVKAEDIDLTVVERGALESADNRDIICRVKAGSKGNYATTIKWVIEDGTPVTKGQPIMILDSSALEDQFRSQKIVLDKARSEWISAESGYKIQLSTNESLIETAKSVIYLKELELERYVGLPKGTLSNRKREEARALIVEMDADLETFLVKHKAAFPDLQGEFHKSINDLTGQIELARADVEMWNDRLAYSRRMELKGYLSPAQVQADESRMTGSKESLKKLETDKMLLQKFGSQVLVKTASSAVQEAWRVYDRAMSEAEANEVQKESARRTTRSVFVQEEEKLREIEEQIRECKIHAPQDGMVVYFIPESSRFSQSERGLIQQGASVQEGQKLMRIPDLSKMQVSTRVHEAMVARIKGDDRRTTGVHESVIAALALNPRPVTAVLPLFDDVLEMQRDEYRGSEYYEAARGQAATLRTDAFPERVLMGHVKSVATVASSSDWMASDVKVYSTVVAIDEQLPGLRPGMNAEVTIKVTDTVKDVLAVPVQAVIGGAESGATRTVYIMTSSGPQEREIKIGLSNEKMAEVRSGLQAGDLVVVNPKAIVGNAVKTRDDVQGGGESKGKGGQGKGPFKGKGGPPADAAKGGPPAAK